MYDIQEAVTTEGTMGLVLFYSFRMDKVPTILLISLNMIYPFSLMLLQKHTTWQHSVYTPFIIMKGLCLPSDI